MYLKIITFIFSVLICHQLNAQGIGINNTGAAPDSSASLDVSSNSKGVLVPRMTMAERDSIINPATSLLIYQTDINPCFYYYNGSNWLPLGCGLNSGNSGGSRVNYQVFTVDGQWVKPSGVNVIVVEAIGAGGGGGGGGSSNGSQTMHGGAGGGGGEYAKVTFHAMALSDTVNIIVGVGGSGGSGTICTNFPYVCNGSPGTAGSSSSFGSYVTAMGGGGGGHAHGNVQNGGHGGGLMGLPIGGVNALNRQGGRGDASNCNGRNAEYGGGGGSISNNNSAGGSSLHGGGGGGHGAMAHNSAYETAGGKCLSYNCGGGGASGTPGQDGAIGTAFSGDGGGGGAREADGGNGGAPGGGGGGGGSDRETGSGPGTGGKGGNGANGEVRVWAW
ncbi:MAG: hypothetical protein MK207_05770 [Saprospiraceae bacterium]|nr:hypothetical protein [Saprospiraceae bacterium]